MPAIVFSCGMGKDSAALLARWLLEPASRTFALDHLIVPTAMVGSEYQTTVRLMETHLLPLMRQHGVRYVQVARQPRAPRTRKVVPGFVVLDDSRNPQRLHPAGPDTLHDEYQRSGTLPQVAKNNRRCSLKYKAEPMDNWIAANITGSYRHVIGYAAELCGRFARCPLSTPTTQR